MDPRGGYGKEKYAQGEEYGNQPPPSRGNPQAHTKKDSQISQTTKEKVEAAKAFLES